MTYLGGKFRVRYQVSEYINALSPRVYLEPFCGYCWVGERVRAQHRYFSDLNIDLIAMWLALQQGWIPPENVTEEDYAKAKKASFDPAMRSFVMSSCSFGGKWGSGFKRTERGLSAQRGFVLSSSSFNGDWAGGFKGRQYAKTASRTLVRRMRSLAFNSEFAHRDFITALDAVDADVVYLDPPYAGAVGYAGAGEPFDSEFFWKAVRKRSDGSRRILVSEYSAPEDFKNVLQANSRLGMRSRQEDGSLQNELRTENLYEYQPPKGRSQIAFSSFLEE